MFNLLCIFLKIEDIIVFVSLVWFKFIMLKFLGLMMILIFLLFLNG